MDGAAKRIKLFARKYLPDEPHHLSLSLDARYPVPDILQWPQTSPLQYSTFLSDANRGILLTRPYYEIRAEPEAQPNSSMLTPRAEPKKALNKMSFKDYQKQKKASLSPTEKGNPGKLDAKKTQSADLQAAKDKDGLRKEQSKPKDVVSQRESNAQDIRTNGGGNKSKSSLPSTNAKSAPTPTSETKKRPVETEDNTRPQKRPKPDEPSKYDPLRHNSRPETPQSKDSTQDRSLSKDTRTAALQSTPSGRNSLGGSNTHRAATTPKVTVNGVKSSASGSNPSISRKPEASGKHLVPPLLSPLRLGIDEEHDNRSPRKRLAEKSLPRSHKLGGSYGKRDEVPPLLSPTLPRMVEEELARLKKTPSKGDSSSQRGSQASNSPSSTRKMRPRTDDVEEPFNPVVTMKYGKYGKRVSKRVQMLLALPPKPPVQRKERSASPDIHQQLAKKRPRPAEPNPEPSSSSTLSSKRLKTTETKAELTSAPAMAKSSITSSKPSISCTNGRQLKAQDTPSSRPPFTPQNPAVATSQAISGSSRTRTPGDQAAHTPTPGNVGPPPPPDPTVLARISILRKRHDEFLALGTKIKHTRDAISQTQQDHLKVTTVMSMEMILCFMIAFKALNQAKELERRGWDRSSWLSMTPHLVNLKHMTRNFAPLHILALQLTGVCESQTMEAYVHLGPRVNFEQLSSQDTMPLLAALSNHNGGWSAAEMLQERIADHRMKTSAIKPWTSPISVANAALPILSRWVAIQQVNWRQSMVVPKDT